MQRSRTHRVENVTCHLPPNLREQVKTVMKAAYRPSADEENAKLKRQATSLQHEYPSAASLLEGPEEAFAVSRLGL